VLTVAASFVIYSCQLFIKILGLNVGISISILSKNKKVSQNCSCQLSYLQLPATVPLPRLDDSHKNPPFKVGISISILSKNKKVSQNSTVGFT
jgi:hypothetical protein